MPHPVPIIIGTTLAVIGSGYAFKKFVYDPHLAPLIDALLTQHRENQRQRHGYEPIPVPVPVHAQAHAHSHSHNLSPTLPQVPLPIPPTSSGRSSAVDNGHQRVSRRRRPAEMYELDETRTMPEDLDKTPPSSRFAAEGMAGRHPLPHAPSSAPVPAYHPPPGGNMHQPTPYSRPHPHQPYQAREMKRPIPPAAHRTSPPAMAQAAQPPVVIQPIPRRVRVPPAPMLINIDAVMNAPNQWSPKSEADADATPIAPHHGGIMHPAPVAVAATTAETATSDEASSVSQQTQGEPLANVGSVSPTIPAEQVVAPTFVAPTSNAVLACATNITALVPSALFSAPLVPLPPSRQSSRSISVIDYTTSGAASVAGSAPGSLVPSPAPLSVSNLSHLSHISRTASASASPSHRPGSSGLSDDLEIISVSGATTSYIDAETYTPRSPRSPASPATPLSRTMSPPVHIDSIALGGFAQPLSADNLSLSNLLGGAPAPIAPSAPSVSSWGEDEQWRSDSEWDALSDAGAGATH